MSQLRETGFFKKNMDVEGIHANCFDTEIEGLHVGDKYILKLLYGATHAIEQDSAKKHQGLLCIQNASVHLEFEPSNMWWLKFDLKPMLQGFDIEDEILADITLKMSQRKTMAARYPIQIQIDGKPVILSINLFANRHIRRNAEKWAKSEGTTLILPAWEPHNGDIVSDIPLLQFRFSLKERDPNLSPLDNYKLSHICESEELALVYEARKRIMNNLNQMKS